MSYLRKKQDKEKLEKLAKKTSGKVRSGAYFDKKKGRYVQWWASSKAGTKGLKTRHSRAVRRKLKASDGRWSGNSYRKLSDYAYDLY